MKSGKLSVSVVCYRPIPLILRQTLESLCLAFQTARSREPAFDGRLVLVVNDGPEALSTVYENLARTAEKTGLPCHILVGHGNVGFARGHNLAASMVTAPYHLVLNPDVILEPDSLLEGVGFLERYPTAGLLAPAAFDPGGCRQYLCRKYPSVTDLWLRGFVPPRYRRAFRSRLAQYELRGICEETIVWNPPLVSGCFMLFRRQAWDAVGGFDPRYFLYFEDYDLSLRIRRVAEVVYVPSVRIRHFGGGAASKGWRHVWLFSISAARFFRTHGWKWV